MTQIDIQSISPGSGAYRSALRRLVLEKSNGRPKKLVLADMAPWRALRAARRTGGSGSGSGLTGRGWDDAGGRVPYEGDAGMTAVRSLGASGGLSWSDRGSFGGFAAADGAMMMRLWIGGAAMARDGLCVRSSIDGGLRHGLTA